MKLVRYVCTHCGRRFEAEEKEILECPGCFWSTSVKKEEDLKESPKLAAAPVPPQAKGPFPPLRLALSPQVSGILVGIVLIVLSFPFWSRFIDRFQEKVLELRPSRLEEKAKKDQVAKAKALGGIASLSETETAILYGRVEIARDRTPSAEEEAILDKTVPFQTGLVQKLPSQAWNLENFKEMLAEQERFYKVPLPGSYKGKLEDLFKKKYVPAAEAFKAGDLIKTRDLWLESLAFPIYANDVKKHRGVVLTMLRPFINDTLAKVGTINSTVVELRIREKESALFENYRELGSLIREKSWAEVAGSILKLEERLSEMERVDELAGQPPAYPKAITQVDDGIRATLAEILTPPPPAVADTTALRQDVLAKKTVVESFLPEKVEAAQARYDAGLEKIRLREWQEAEQELRQVELPLALAKDAREKVKVLKKLVKTGLDSGTKSG